MKRKINKVTIKGTVVGNPELFYVTQEDEFYSILVETKRQSGNVDVVPVVVPRATIDPTADYRNLRMEVEGSLQSRRDDNHLYIYVFAPSGQIYASTSDEEDVNEFELHAKFKRCISRVTPLTNKKIADVYVVYNAGDDSYFFPCITWNHCVDMVEELRKNDRIKLYGRFQSRTYNKDIGNGEVEERIAYELSAYKIK